MIYPYMPEVGPLENAMIGSIPIGNAQLPYRYVLAFATIVIGHGYYGSRAPKAWTTIAGDDEPLRRA